MKRAPRGPFSYLLDRVCGRTRRGSHRGQRSWPTGGGAEATTRHFQRTFPSRSCRSSRSPAVLTLVCFFFHR